MVDFKKALRLHREKKLAELKGKAEAAYARLQETRSLEDEQAFINAQKEALEYEKSLSER